MLDVLAQFVLRVGSFMLSEVEAYALLPNFSDVPALKQFESALVLRGLSLKQSTTDQHLCSFC